MKAKTREWVELAEADYAAAAMLRRSRKRRTRDLACFHLQQCVEKYLKAWLEEEGLAVPKTHDLVRLLEPLLRTQPLWHALKPELAILSGYAVESRYPRDPVTPNEARDLTDLTTRCRDLMRERLGIT
ncbi:MAG TPA: HEPN domain-containing protein [Tepidisphaeraceae bacterium]|jgi:HEPN domain-containing protein